MKLSLAFFLAGIVGVSAAGTVSNGERELRRYYPIHKPTKHGPVYKTPYPTHTPPTPYPVGLPTPYSKPTYPKNPYPANPYPPRPRPRPQATPMPTHTPTHRPTPDPTPLPTYARSYDPTYNPTTKPTKNPTDEPSPAPSPPPTTYEPSPAPSPEPTLNPTLEPSPEPSPEPTLFPTEGPTNYPTSSEEPSESPSDSSEPSESPTHSEEPSESPTHSEEPSESPTDSLEPSASPTFARRTVYDIVCNDAFERVFGVFCRLVNLFPDLVLMLGGDVSVIVLEEPEVVLDQITIIMARSDVRKLNEKEEEDYLIAAIIENEKGNMKEDVTVELIDFLSRITVFVPTNNAFRSLPREVLDSLVTPGSLDALEDILRYHIIGTEVYFNQLVCDEQRVMENGEKTTTECKADGFKYQVGIGNLIEDEPRIVETNILADNGVIHVVDQVILPDIAPVPGGVVLTLNIAVELGANESEELVSIALADALSAAVNPPVVGGDAFDLDTSAICEAVSCQPTFCYDCIGKVQGALSKVSAANTTLNDGILKDELQDELPDVTVIDVSINGRTINTPGPTPSPTVAPSASAYPTQL